MGGTLRAQQKCCRIGRAGRGDEDIALETLQGAGFVLGDDRGDLLAGPVGFQADRLVARQEGDVGQLRDRFDDDGAGVGLGLQQAGKAAAGRATHAMRGLRIAVIAINTQRQGRGMPADILEVLLQRGDAGIVEQGRIGVGRIVRQVVGIDAALAVHAPQLFSLFVIGRVVGIGQRPGRRQAVGVLDVLEVALFHAHQGRAIEGGIAADPVIGVGDEGFVVLVEPLFLGAVAVLDEDGVRIPVLRFLRQVLAALQDQDFLAGIGHGIGQRAAAGARSDDDDVVVLAFSTGCIDHGFPFNLLSPGCPGNLARPTGRPRSCAEPCGV